MHRSPSVLITGASSGIGQALALALAGPGVTLHLSGRDQPRLDAVAEACQARGAQVDARLVDVRDAPAMAAWIEAAGPLDLVVANAGISAGTGDRMPESPDQVRAIFATDVDGVLNTVLPAMEVMARQAPGGDGLRGRIAAIASIAAFLAAPGAPAYCAAKAAVDTWMVASAPTARARGIALTSVCPGYVRTGMTSGNRFRMPGLMDADRAARITLRGIAAGRTRVVFPWWMGLAARLAGSLPPRVLAALSRTQPGKAGLDETVG
jgi:NAD(P)-dependent dehydrogenase (short-subunit alcohol dehydrogenase family)